MLTTFGEGGRQPGEFYGPHSIATDSKGNIYVTETYRGQRVQKFVYKGSVQSPRMTARAYCGRRAPRSNSFGEFRSIEI